MLVIKNPKDADKVRIAGDQYFVDVYPDPPVTDEEVADYEERFQAASKIETQIEAVILKKLTNSSNGNGNGKGLDSGSREQVTTK